MSETKKPRGRPRSENPKRHAFVIRVSAAEREAITAAALSAGVSVAELMRRPFASGLTRGDVAPIRRAS
jgi:hypothetical protein